MKILWTKIGQKLCTTNIFWPKTLISDQIGISILVVWYLLLFGYLYAVFTVAVFSRRESVNLGGADFLKARIFLKRDVSLKTGKIRNQVLELSKNIIKYYQQKYPDLNSL